MKVLNTSLFLHLHLRFIIFACATLTALSGCSSVTVQSKNIGDPTAPHIVRMKRLNKQVDEANLLVKQGKLQEAEAILISCRKEDPENLIATNDLANVYAMQDEAELAFPLYEEVLASGNNLGVESWALYARVSSRLGKRHNESLAYRSILGLSHMAKELGWDDWKSRKMGNDEMSIVYATIANQFTDFNSAELGQQYAHLALQQKELSTGVKWHLAWSSVNNHLLDEAVRLWREIAKTSGDNPYKEGASIELAKIDSKSRSVKKVVLPKGTHRFPPTKEEMERNRELSEKAFKKPNTAH
ncbi:MAG TPA: tetratricopeptide repeat protein [Fimbriimonadaceae bacterium]|nr:tetratricopeptide repeat protein [Fimbriimonadaceae bacterium]